MSRRSPANSHVLGHGPAPRPAKPDPAARRAPKRPPERTSALAILREWADALVIAFVATMFVRIFMVEIFKIPSSSMTPTLIGGRIINADVNGDGRPDLVLLPDRGEKGAPFVFLNDGQRLAPQPGLAVDLSKLPPARERYDHILVNKLSYWFHPPRRGDIVVFKVPVSIYEKDKPIYIKRCVGEPGEEIGFDGDGHLMAAGKRVSEPEFFDSMRYLTLMDAERPPIQEIAYSHGTRYNQIQSIQVPDGEVYVFGDNTYGSYDSRYWGGVPLQNVKGRAFFRFRPWKEMKFFKGS